MGFRKWKMGSGKWKIGNRIYKNDASKIVNKYCTNSIGVKRL